MAGLTVWGAFSLCLILGSTVVLLQRMVAREDDVFVKRVLVLGLLGKLASSVVRYVVITEVYGTGDAFRYLFSGEEIAAGLRQGVLPEGAFDTGTASMEFLTGIVFALTQPNELIGFTVFSLLAFAGAILAFKAFCLGFPEGDRRRYAVLVLLTPTMLFWPASIGKDAWLVFSLGLGSYGVARILRRRTGGYLLATLGVAGAYLIRPHMGTLLLVTALVGFVIRFRDPDVKRGAVAWLLGLGLVGGGAGFVLVNFSDDLLPQDEVAESLDVDELLTETERRTATGGSEFVATPVNSIRDLPSALITVPFRPFPWEAEGIAPTLSSLEGVALLAFALLSLPRLRGLPRALLDRPYVAFAGAYALGFIVAFSTVGNFGILARQRTQFLPLVAVLLALPPAAERIGRRRRGVGAASHQASRTSVQPEHQPVGAPRSTT